MLPEKYIRDMESSRRRSKLFSYLGFSAVFIFTALVGGQVLHESAHILWLEVQSCPYEVSYGFGSGGLYGSVDPGCFLDKAKLTVFYTSGYMTTLIAALVSGISGMRSRDSTKRLALSSGLLMSILISITVAGDFDRAASALEVSRSVSRGLGIFMTIGILGSTLKLSDTAFKRLER
jgi:hypothetical protein